MVEFEEVRQGLTLLGGDQGQEDAAFGDFAVILLAVGRGHGDGASVLVTTQCDDHTAFAVADALAVQSQAAGQQSRMGLQEGGESVCTGRGVVKLPSRSLSAS